MVFWGLNPVLDIKLSVVFRKDYVVKFKSVCLPRFIVGVEVEVVPISPVPPAPLEKANTSWSMETLHGPNDEVALCCCYIQK